MVGGVWWVVGVGCCVLGGGFVGGGLCVVVRWGGSG